MRIEGWRASLMAALLPICAVAAFADPALEPEILELIRKSEAAQSAGDFEQAHSPLLQARALAEKEADPFAIATVRAAIGNLYIAVAEPADAIEELEEALALVADRSDASNLQATAQVALGNAMIKLAEGQSSGAALASRRRALTSFRRAAKADDPAVHAALRARAHASALRVSIDLAEPDVKKQLTDTQAAINQVRDSNAKTTLLLHLARSLERFAASPRADNTDQPETDIRLTIHRLLTRAIDLAAEAQDDRSHAHALIQLAELYQSDARFDDAATLAERAVRHAQRSDDAALRWRSWIVLGRIHRQRDQPDAAIDAFAQGLDEVDALRHRRQIAYGLVPSVRHAEVMRAQTEFVDLVLVRASRRTEAEVDAIQEDLALAQQSMERLKAGELRDYFDDECVDAALSRSVNVRQVDERTALIYPIALPDRLELLVSTSKGRSRISVSVTADEVEKTARRLRSTLEDRITNRYRVSSQKIYDWVIRPLHGVLEAERIRTLIFIPGGWLRSIPMAALHDGERFVIEKFEVAVTPGLELTDPRPMNLENPLALFAGLSHAVEGFEPLPGVEQELAAISGFFPGKTLLNERFVPETIHGELSRKPYSVVHIASHAEFSSSNDAFMLTYAGPISVSDLSEYVSLFKNRTRPLELLMLSACETALGDDRAALGLSGIAVKAGARSAVGSLWRVPDAAARTFSTRFYEALSQPNVSRARAIQRAQIALIKTPDFSHPSHWAPFILIGTWL